MITDADYADDIKFLENTAAQSLLHSLKRAPYGVDLFVNSDKIEFMCFNENGDISTLNGRSLKLVRKFTTIEAATHPPKMTSISD